MFLWNGEGKEEKPMGFLDRYKKPEEDAQGWICPKCGKVLAPFIIYCPFCTNPEEENKRPAVSEEMKKEFASASQILNEWLNGDGGGR
jgi:hypothetical protein